MNTVIYLCRHGDAENPNKIWYGRLPGFPLSEQGKAEAHALGRALAKYPIAAVYASPLDRTYQTAQIASSYVGNVRVRTDDRLLDIVTPTMGLAHQEMDKIHWNFYSKNLIAEGGETIGHIRDRMFDMFGDILERHNGKHILITSHGDNIMIVRLKLLGIRLTLNHMRTDYIGKAQGYAIHFDKSNHFTHLEPLRIEPTS